MEMARATARGSPERRAEIADEGSVFKLISVKQEEEKDIYVRDEERNRDSSTGGALWSAFFTCKKKVILAGMPKHLLEGESPRRGT